MPRPPGPQKSSNCLEGCRAARQPPLQGAKAVGTPEWMRSGDHRRVITGYHDSNDEASSRGHKV